jgi:hypothetical protein
MVLITVVLAAVFKELATNAWQSGQRDYKYKSTLTFCVSDRARRERIRIKILFMDKIGIIINIFNLIQFNRRFFYFYWKDKSFICCFIWIFLGRMI